MPVQDGDTQHHIQVVEIRAVVQSSGITGLHHLLAMESCVESYSSDLQCLCEVQTVELLDVGRSGQSLIEDIHNVAMKGGSIQIGDFNMLDVDWQNPEKTFDWFFEVACPKSSDDDPTVLRQFPDQFDQESIQTLCRFCYPFDVERVKENTVVQHFTFVLTDLEGNQRFGFCRLAVGFKSCLCILSYLPWFEVFYKVLNNIAEHLAKEGFSDMIELLTSLYQHPVPQLNGAPSLHFLSYFVTPVSGSLPTIQKRNLTEFVVTVDVNNMLQLYASMLYERRILITSSKLSTVRDSDACVHASSTLLYPMYWQHIYIPMLPPHLLDYCCAPMPYLIGVHTSLMERVRSRALEDVVILDVDTNTVESPFQDLESLPGHVVSLLRLRLKKQSVTVGDGIARAFLRAQALLFGSYRDALICIPNEPISFCEESVPYHKSSSIRRFLQNAVHLQLFKQFMEGRLENLNSGVGFSDIFEEEINDCGLASGSSKSYQLWLDSVKKRGDVLIHTVKNKANPAMKNMYKYAKGQAKIGLKEMRNRFRYKDMCTARELQRGSSLRCDQMTSPGFHKQPHDCLQSRLPITKHFGQSRPRRPNRNYQETQNSSASQAQRENEQETSMIASDLDQEFEENLLEQEELDLLGEIFDTLSTQASGERVLYGTRSLDFFNLDEGSYMTRVKSLDAPSNENLSYESERDSESYKGQHWYLEEDSLKYNMPSSEEICGQSAQEVPGLPDNAMDVSPSVIAKHLKRSEMRDQGSTQKEETTVLERDQHHTLVLGNSEAGCEQAIGRAEAAEEPNCGEAKKKGCGLQAREHSTGALTQPAQQHPGDPNDQHTQSERESRGSSVQSAVGQQTERTVKNKFPTSPETKNFPLKKTLGAIPQTEVMPLSPLLQIRHPEPNVLSLPKVAELKKRFEA
ncbi:DENN domain-containing protein 1C [Microcaecilia unicolor]|uniref:DENN domain-containing protein 1C n=1 Tax=Microcaecilia unicolor TaxID=1415580 RepID=A0A6P7X4L6_9AMPH|nr:DENN domain-containing protein 1C [Microcaecilia unicolor]